MHDPKPSAVRQVRKGLGMTQDRLAEASGLKDRTRIASIEAGRIKARSPEVRRGLAQGFGLSLDQIDALLAGDLSPADAIAVANPPPPPPKHGEAA